MATFDSKHSKLGIDIIVQWIINTVCPNVTCAKFRSLTNIYFIYRNFANILHMGQYYLEFQIT